MLDRPKRRVLVADDVGSMAEMVADSLVDRGFEATACTTGARALELLSGQTFDALVTDLRMPGTNPLRSLGEMAGKVSPEYRLTAMELVRDAVRRELEERGEKFE